MHTFRHFVVHFRRYGQKHKALYFLSLMILFWGVFDGIMSYIVPQIITEGGLSKTMMGIIISTSSVAGILFDLLACRIFKNTIYKRLFLLMFVVCSIYPLILLGAKTFIIFFVAMALWGIYYDLKNFANFDFVGRFTAKEEHASSFGVIQVFQAVGYLFAPILAGLLIGEAVGFKPFFMAWIFLGISGLFYLSLVQLTKKSQSAVLENNQKYRWGLWSEVKIWSKLGRLMLPVLLLTMMLNVVDSFFWTIGPLFAKSLASPHQLAGLFMTAYSLPSLLIGWVVGRFTSKYGKKRTAFMSLMAGSCLLILLFMIKNPAMIVLTVFFASLLMSMAWPAINGAYADYISETDTFEKEIEGLEDFYTNAGYIVGPILAGVIADRVGNAGSFSVLGILGVTVAIILLKITPREIKIGITPGRCRHASITQD